MNIRLKLQNINIHDTVTQWPLATVSRFQENGTYIRV